jgi:hypothetical protein
VISVSSVVKAFTTEDTKGTVKSKS